MITLFAPGGRYMPRLLLRDEKRVETLAVLGNVPGVTSENGVVSVPAEPRLYEILVEHVGAKPDQAVVQWYEKAIAHEKKMASALVDKQNFAHPMADLLRPYQRVGVSFVSTAGRCLLADQMGLGKTVETILGIDISSRNKNVLVICPNSVKWQWAGEISKWSAYQHPVTVIEPKTAKASLKEYREGWLIMNYHNLRAFSLPFIQWDWVVFDEAHFMSNRQTKTVYKAKKLAAANMIMLTGTPIGNNTADLWSLLNILYPQRFTSYWRFYELYVDYEEDYFGSRTVRGTRNETYLRRELAPVMLRRTKEDVHLDIPPKTVVEVPVEMTKSQEKYYRDMALTSIAEAQGKEVHAFAEIAVITRLRQIVSTPATIGFEDSSGKLDAAIDIITGTDEQVVVFSLFKPTIASLAERLKQVGVTYAVITGDVSAEEREIARQRLDSGEARVLLATLGAGGTGLNLQAASVGIFIEHHWNPREQHQAEGRLHRIGQKNPVTIFNLICRSSIDSAVEAIISKKQMISDAILKEALVEELARFKKGIRKQLEELYKL